MMSGKRIALIYFYLISAAALALIVVGVFNTVNFVINVTQYDKYPLRYQAVRCLAQPYKAPIPVTDMPTPATPSPEELQNQQKDCEMQLELDRKQQKLDDLKSAVTFSLVGTILFLIHFPQARKQSK